MTDSTQDKAAVGPLSAGDLNRAHAAWLLALAKLPDDVEVNMTTEEAQTALRAALEAVILAPTAPNLSTKPPETNTSAGRVKETAKNEHVAAPVEADCGIHGKVPGPICIRCAELGSPMGSTAPVEAGGSFEERAIMLTKKHGNPVGTDYEQGQNDMGHRMVTMAREADAAIAALRPQPSGETPGAAEAFDAVDVADRLIERAYGDEVPVEWTKTFKGVAKARSAMKSTAAKEGDAPQGDAASDAG